MEKLEYYELGDTIDEKELRARISDTFKAVFERSLKQKKRYLDTFDFKLWSEGLYLVCDKKSFILQNSHLDNPVAELEASGRKEPEFWWELPNCDLKQELRERIEVRALLPVMDIEKAITPVRILNEDNKTVLNLSIEQTKTAGNDTGALSYLCLRPLRGYGRELSQFKRYLADLDLKEFKGEYLGILLKSLGKDPKDYSSKLRIELAPELSSFHADVVIMKDLLRIIRLNEEGILKDIDIEFLHDFRVAIRRTRSALTQIKGVLPEDVTDDFKVRFSRIGKMTNQLRDLDIYLLDKERYRAMLPVEIRPGLEHMFSIFSEKRKREHREIVKFLKSKEYKETMDMWENYLNEPRDNITIPNAGVPVFDLASGLIRKKYKRILRDGALINDDTPDPELHKLRIECKKLRYMIEFFSSLYPEEDIKTLVRHMKKLQDNLGEFNDLSVQRASLKEFIDGLDPSDDIQRQCIVSSGGLISVLFERQKEVRSEFEEKFNEFRDKETKAVFKKSFSSKPAQHG